MSKRVNRDDIDKFHDYSLYIPTRTIYMGSEHVNEETFEDSGVDASMTERQIKNLHILDLSSDAPITIIMNNPGGDVVNGIAIYDAIKVCRSHITVKVFGQASSMGSIILQAADKRLMTPNSVQMIHYGRFSIEDNDEIVFKHAEESRRVNKWVEDIYLDKIKMKHPQFKLNKLKKMLSHDTFLTAQMSLELNLCDGIIGEDEE